MNQLLFLLATLDGILVFTVHRKSGKYNSSGIMHEPLKVCFDMEFFVIAGGWHQSKKNNFCMNGYRF